MSNLQFLLSIFGDMFSKFWTWLGSTEFFGLGFSFRAFFLGALIVFGAFSFIMSVVTDASLNSFSDIKDTTEKISIKRARKK